MVLPSTSRLSLHDVDIVEFNDITYDLRYNFVSWPTEILEGQVAEFEVETRAVAPGTEVQYVISGVSESDVVGGLTGYSTVNEDGSLSINVSVASDSLLEGTEDLKLEI